MGNIQLTDDQEIELISKYRETLICPKCQKEQLVHPHYLLNKATLRGFLLGVVATVIVVGIFKLF